VIVNFREFMIMHIKLVSGSLFKNSSKSSPLVLLLLLLFLTGCPSSHYGHRTGTIIVGISSGPSTLDPRTATDAVGQRIVELLFSPLVRIGKNLQAEPHLAQSWEYRNLQYTFHLRDDFKFSDGKPVNANDVAYSFEVDAAKGSPFSTVFDNVEKWETPNARTLIVKLKKPDAQFLINLFQIAILPKHLIESSPAAFQNSLIGSGVFKLVSQNDNEIILAFNALNPMVKKPGYQNLIFKIIHDDNTRYLKALNEEVDILQNDMPEVKVPALLKSGLFVGKIGPGLNFNYLLVNHHDPFLKLIEVRRALDKAINRAEIIRYKLADLAEEARSLLAPVNPFSTKDLPPAQYDLASARNLLRNIQMPLRPLVLKTASNEQAKDIGLILASQFEKLGIPMDLKSFEWATYYADVKAGNFQLATMRWTGIVDPNIYREVYSSHEFPPGKNRGFYKNMQVDKLVEQGLQEMSPKRRKQIYDRVQRLVYDDLAVIPLWYNKNICLAHNRIRNYDPSPNGSFYPLAFITVQ